MSTNAIDSTATGFQIQPERARAAVGNVGALVVQALTLSQELDSLLAPPAAFARIGQVAAAGSTELHTEQLASLRSLLGALDTLATLIGYCVSGYESADAQVSALFGRTVAGDSLGTSGADHPAGALWSVGTGPLTALRGAGSASLDANAVAPVVAHLVHGGHWDRGSVPPTFSGARQFADWLDAAPEHQAQAGVVGVYLGGAGTSGGLPAAARVGDVVVVTHGGYSVVGIRGEDGVVYNDGKVQLSGIDTVRLYRPIGTGLMTASTGR